MNTNARAPIEQGIKSCVRRIGRRVLIDGTRFDAVVCGEEPNPDARPTFETIPQVVKRHPAFTEASLRQVIYRAEKAPA